MSNEEASTALNTRANSPLPKVDTIDDAATAVTTRPGSAVLKANEETEKGAVSLTPGQTVDESKLLTGRKLFLVFVGFMLSILLVALDQTIVATALPKLASDFNALDQLTWVITGYFLTQAGLMLPFGQVLTIVPTKWVYLLCIFVFELGSLICAVAPTMNALIAGRAIAGVGASGIFISILTVLAQVTRLEQRPALFGSFGAVFALASVIGPLLGGVFTEKLSWRWCFWINLPFGAVSILAVVIWLPAHPVPEIPAHAGKTLKQKWLGLDWVGAILSLAMITTLLLPLQWGGNTRPWNDKLVIALFAVFGVLLIAFVGWEFYMGEAAMMPLHMFKRRTQVGASLEMFLLMMGFLLGIYYLPYYYQAARGRSPSESGIDIIPFMVFAVVGTMGSGLIINKTGRYWPFLVVGPCIAAVGAGLLYTIDVHTSTAKLVGFQLIYGLGLGLAFQNTMISIQAEYADRPEIIPQANSLLSFLQLLGGVVGIAIAGTVFGNRFYSELSSSTLSHETIAAVRQSVEVLATISEDVRAQVIEAYVEALDITFIVAVPACGLAALSSLLVKNWNLKERGAAGGGMAV